jgi:hypothetical protein
MANFEVTVSNVGTLLTGKYYRNAQKEFNECKKLISEGYGSYNGETVTLFADGEVKKEYEAAKKSLISLRYLDTCYPDYFQGFGGEVFAVPVDSKMRNGEVLNALHSEIRAWSGYMNGEQSTEEDYEALHKSADELFEDSDKRKNFCSSAGDETYAYFGVLIDSNK